MTTHPRAGQVAQDSDLIDIAALVTAYYTGHPDVAEPAQRVAFGLPLRPQLLCFGQPFGFGQAARD